MSETHIQDYIKAGKAVIAAKKLAKRIIKPGIAFLEVANRCEAEITKTGCGLSFPINLSLNEIAAHYSPPIGDATIIPEKGLLKIDIGSHFNGYIADSAFTINLDEDPKLQNYIDAAREAVDAAIKLFNPGIKLYELGEVIKKKIIDHGLWPITDLGGHELKQYNLHAGKFIPNFKDINRYQVLKPGDAYACEPFATSGVGKIDYGTDSYIFRFLKKVKKHITIIDKGYMNNIQKNFKKLPFSPRWISDKDLIPQDKIKNIIKSFLGRNILDDYPILLERAREPVAQEEHTIILDLDGNKIVTTRE
ncbi:MAG: type II methionyl aminopeptidase [Promethearchaeota archaeon]|jgi:methionyl aminopeptidase